jgi:hypothetical protein
MYGLVVIRLSIKVYNPADIPDGERPAMRRMTPGGGMTVGPPSPRMHARLKSLNYRESNQLLLGFTRVYFYR